MILGLSIDQFISIATFLGGGILGALVLIGRAWGSKNPPKTEFEVAGALVDNRAVDRLTVALEGHTMALATAHADHEKGRALGYKLVDALIGVGDEVEELRRAAQDIATQIARKT